MTLESLESKALKLPLKDRGKLAAKLIASLDHADPREVEEMWTEEAQRRHKDLLAGRVKLLPAASAMARVKKALKR